MARNIAVVGAGYWGKNLVRNFAELGALHTICDANPSVLQQLQARYPGVNTETKYSQVLQDICRRRRSAYTVHSVGEYCLSPERIGMDAEPLGSFPQPGRHLCNGVTSPPAPLLKLRRGEVFFERGLRPFRLS